MYRFRLVALIYFPGFYKTRKTHHFQIMLFSLSLVLEWEADGECWFRAVSLHREGSSFFRKKQEVKQPDCWPIGYIQIIWGFENGTLAHLIATVSVSYDTYKLIKCIDLIAYLNITWIQNLVWMNHRYTKLVPFYCSCVHHMPSSFIILSLINL